MRSGIGLQGSCSPAPNHRARRPPARRSYTAPPVSRAVWALAFSMLCQFANFRCGPRCKRIAGLTMTSWMDAGGSRPCACQLLRRRRRSLRPRKVHPRCRHLAQVPRHPGQPAACGHQGLRHPARLPLQRHHLPQLHGCVAGSRCLRCTVLRRAGLCCAGLHAGASPPLPPPPHPAHTAPVLQPRSWAGWASRSPRRPPLPRFSRSVARRRWRSGPWASTRGCARRLMGGRGGRSTRAAGSCCRPSSEAAQVARLCPACYRCCHCLPSENCVSLGERLLPNLANNIPLHASGHPHAAHSSLAASVLRLVPRRPLIGPFSGGMAAGKAVRAPRSMAVPTQKAASARPSICACMPPGMGTSENQEATPAQGACARVGVRWVRRGSPGTGQQRRLGRQAGAKRPGGAQRRGWRRRGAPTQARTPSRASLPHRAGCR